MDFSPIVYWPWYICIIFASIRFKVITFPEYILYTSPLAILAFPSISDSKAFACNAGDLGLIPGPGRSPEEGNGNPLQYSCLENSIDRGAWWATAHGVTELHMTEWLTHTHTVCFNIIKLSFLHNIQTHYHHHHCHHHQPLMVIGVKTGKCCKYNLNIHD